MSSDKSRVVALRQARQALSQEAFHWFSAQELLTAQEVGTLLGIGPPHREVSRWRQQGRLIGIPVSRGHVYPAIQIDRERRRLRPDLVRLNVLSPAGGDPWAVVERWRADARLDPTPPPPSSPSGESTSADSRSSAPSSETMPPPTTSRRSPGSSRP